MKNQDGSTQVNIDAIIERITYKQMDWILARLFADSDAKAAKAVGVRPETVCRWPDKKDMDKVVRYFKKHQIPAARTMLESAATQAAQVLIQELRGKQKRQAANDILDRTGLPRLTKVAPVTPDGKKQYKPFDLESLTDAELDELGDTFAKITTKP